MGDDIKSTLINDEPIACAVLRELSSSARNR